MSLIILFVLVIIKSSDLLYFYIIFLPKLLHFILQGSSYILQITMNPLKQMFNTQKYKPSNNAPIDVSAFKKKYKWDDLQSALQSQQQKNKKSNAYNNTEERFLQTIKNNFENGSLFSCQILYRDLHAQFKESTSNKKDSDLTDEIMSILKAMIGKQASSTLKNYLQISVQQLKKQKQSKKKQQKEKYLSQYNKYQHNLTQVVKPKAENSIQFMKPSQKSSFVSPNQASKKLLHSTSLTNIKIRNRREEQDVNIDLKRKKSLDYKLKNAKSAEKLNSLFKPISQTNNTVVKKQYDFSAIFQASRTNIQSRNRTFKTTTEIKKQQKKMNKNKKDEAFVFYRPTNKKKG